MARWQPMASIVTTAPSIAIMSSSAGMATISLDFSVTAICPITSRCRAAKAETVWIGSLAFFFEPERRDVLPSMAMTSAGVLIERRNPGDEAASERLGVERGEDVAEMIMRRRAVLERPEAAQQRKLLFAKASHVGEGLGSRQHGEQTQKQNLVERIEDLAGLPMVRHIFEIGKKNSRF